MDAAFLIVAQAAGADPVTPWLTPIYNLGGFGLLLFLYITERVKGRGTYDEKAKESEAWKQAYLIEREAHLALQQDRTDEQQDRKAQLERDQITHKLLEEIREAYTKRVPR